MNVDGNFPSYETQQEIKNTVNGIKNTTDSTKTSVDQVKQDVANVSTQIANKNVGKVLKSRTYTSNGTFTVPAGVTEVYLTGGGGGGGGGGKGTLTGASGNAGGVTSFGSLFSLPGGSGGNTSLTNKPTRSGGPGGSQGAPSSSIPCNGGHAAWYAGGFGNTGNDGSEAGNGAYCAGGGGLNSPGGGAGAFVIRQLVSVTSETTYQITIGSKGYGGSGTNSGGASVYGGDGGPGILTIEWWE